MFKEKFDLIITIVNKGSASTVIEAAQDSGARGATVIKGHGSGLKDVIMLFEVPIEPEKDIVLCVVPENISQDVVASITAKAALEKVGAGISFILPLKDVVGLVVPDAKRSALD